MEQQQFNVSFSVGTKLLISVVSLLLLVIVFLDVSTILLLTEDKRAYTYQAQSTEAQLAGQEFTGAARVVIDALRISLANVDPTGKFSPAQRSAVQSVLDNQGDLLGLQIHLVSKGNRAESRMVLEMRKDEALKKYSVAIEDLIVSRSDLEVVQAQFIQEGFAFLNLSRIGKTPLLAIVVADRSSTSLEMPVSIGVLPLSKLGKGARTSSLIITDLSGRALLSSDAQFLYPGSSLGSDPLLAAARASQVSEGALEFENEGKRFLGSYDRPGYGLLVLTRTEWRKAMRAAYTLAERFVFLGIMSIGAAILFAVIFSKSLTAPLHQLYRATRQVSSGNFNVDLKNRSKDEFGALSRSFNSMSQKITDLLADSVAEGARKEHLENELAIASAVQQTLFPPSQFQNENLLMRSHYQSATECGGDWWGYFGVGDQVCLMIADATGHGLPSALITAAARSCFSVMHKLAQEDPDFTYSPGSMLSYANRVVHDAANGQINMTFFVGVVDFKKGVLTYSSAGHNPPWLFKKEDSKFSLKSLVALGQRLGESRDVPEYEEKSINVAAGDILFLYTDGLVEGKNQAGEMYGKKRMRKFVESGLAAGPADVLSKLLGDFEAHNQGKPLDDDVTLAVAQFLRFGNT